MFFEIKIFCFSIMNSGSDFSAIPYIVSHCELFEKKYFFSYKTNFSKLGNFKFN